MKKSSINISAEVTKQELEVVKESLPIDNLREESFPEDGNQLLKGTKEFLVEQGLIKKDFDLEDWILRRKNKILAGKWLLVKVIYHWEV